jgi:DedD protein
MRENSRLKQQPFELSLGVKQVGAVLVTALLIMGAVFALGLGLGRRSSPAPEGAVAAPRDALARLDEPLPAKDESPPELKAHQALTDSRSIDKTMPMPAVGGTPLNGTKVSVAPAPHAEERTAPDREVVMPPAIPAQEPAAPPAPAVDAAAGSDRAQATAPAVAVPVANAPAPASHARPAARESRRDAREVSRVPSRAKPGAKAGPKPKGKGAYTIQVASTQRRGDAERVAKRLAARRPRIVAADVPGKGRWYRVQVGSYETRESARVALLSMSGVHGVVTPARLPTSGR